MKRCLAALLLLIMTMMMNCGLGRAEENELPIEIQNIFDHEKTVVGVETFSRSGSFLFAVTKDQNKERILYGFQYEDEAWNCFLKTKKVFPDNDLQVYVSARDEYHDSPEVIPRNIPYLILKFLETDADHASAWMTFLYDGSHYILYEVIDYRHSVSVHYQQGSALIYDDDSFSFQKADVQYDVPVDLASFDYEAFLSFVGYWNEKYAELTDHVYFDEYQPLLYAHPTDQLFTVYSAPSAAAFVEANGKAKVSTNDWILIYGREKNYDLIQYSINESTRRFGYIQSGSLSPSDTGELVWMNQETVLRKKTVLVNDPCGTKVRSFPAGTKIKFLGRLNEWAFVEVETVPIVRGFVEYQFLVENSDLLSGQ